MKSIRFVPVRVGAGLALALALSPVAWAGGAQLASDMGCLNCHGSAPRGDAPSFERLGQRLEGRRGDSGVADHLTREIAETGGRNGIVGHRQLSPAATRELVQWLAEGAKQGR